MYAVTAQGGIVGVAGLTSIDRLARRAEFSLYIGPEHHGEGYGRKALIALFTKGFRDLGLNLIWGESFDGNPAIRLFESLGMIREGTRRDFYFKDGRFIDAHLFSIRSTEWKF
jgi:RimJ/RimL family protein N-acetyltransferase